MVARQARLPGVWPGDPSVCGGLVTQSDVAAAAAEFWRLRDARAVASREARVAMERAAPSAAEESLEVARRDFQVFRAILPAILEDRSRDEDVEWVSISFIQDVYALWPSRVLRVIEELRLPERQKQIIIDSLI